MIKIISLILLLLFSLLLESTLVSFPFVLITSIIFYVFYPRVRTLLLIFLVGIALDVSRVYFIGLTPLITFIIIFILNLNERVFDIRDYIYLITVVIFGSIVYSNIVDYQVNKILIGMVFGIFILSLSMILNKHRKSYGEKNSWSRIL